MPYFIDIDQISIRGGTEDFKFGDPYTASGVGRVEHDRYVYISNLTGSFHNLREALRQIAELGRKWGWVGIRWERIKDGKTHIFEIKI